MEKENLALLSLVLLLVASPLVAAAWLSDSDVEIVAWSESGVGCGGSGRSYGANSTYEANLRHLAAVLPDETSASASLGHRVERAIGYWPNRVQASATCWSGDDGDCATCIVEAFKEVERVCPFRREATFFGRDCYLHLAEFRVFSIDVFGKFCDYILRLISFVSLRDTITACEKKKSSRQRRRKQSLCQKLTVAITEQSSIRHRRSWLTMQISCCLTISHAKIFNSMQGAVHGFLLVRLMATECFTITVFFLKKNG
jgi:hypothetical protein